MNLGNQYGRKGYKKHFNGKFKQATKGTEVCFGTIGLLALSSGELKENVLIAMKKVVLRNLKDRGKVYVRICPNYSVSKKSKDATLGGGAGKFDHRAAFVSKGKILLEISGLPEQEGRETLVQAGHKCPLKTSIITRRKYL